MSRIDTTFAALQANQQKALIPYVMAGDPNPEMTVNLLHELVNHGADIIEVGLPFSDPMADGEIIATAGERALAAGTSTRDAIAMVKQFRQVNQHTPIIVMGYLNPVEIIGYDAFVELCHEAGIDGILLVDLPPDEVGNLGETLKRHDMNEIFLLAPTTEPKRREQVLGHGSGFIYYVSLKGVTGAGNLDTDAVATQVQQIKSETRLPVCVGFGIRDAESVKAIGKHADGVVVGSELVKHFAGLSATDDAGAAKAKLLAKLDELKAALTSL